ncbi:hypothetical protein IAD21_00465 [Abditibacteriota bacterium]|nr:hypothetical protein IAD21_00465 [Abditibacteriota bacterium]
MSNAIKHILTGALVCGALWGALGSAHAATYRWVGPDNSSWNNAANWLPRVVPGAADDVTIDDQRIVSVPVGLDILVANLTVGAGAQIKNGGKIKVSKITNSLGLFTGAGTLDIPAGATATYNVTAANQLATVVGTSTPVVFAPINNQGTLVTKVAPGCRVDFAPISNNGTIQILSDGTVTFKDIKNTQNLDISASGTLTLAKIDNATGASLFIASTLPPSLSGVVGNTTSGLLGDNGTIDTDDPSVVHLDSLSNHVGGTVKLTGFKLGRYFNGTSITNEGSLKISGAQTMLDGDVTNTAGALFTVESDAKIFPDDGTAPKLNNAGKILKPAGSDATLNVAWSNSGQVIIENGTLHVAIPLGKGCKQMSGLTTLEGGVLAVEDPLGLLPVGTFELAGGMLDGIGTIQGNLLNSGGHISPGHSPGTITINGNFTQTANGVLDMEIGGTNPGTSYDQILVNGTAYLDGTLNWVRWQDYVPHNGDVYTLFTYYSKSGKFAKFVDKSPVAGITYDTTLTPSDYEVNCYSNATTDGTPPVVSITNPVDGRAAPSFASASGKASDSAGVKNVTCRLYRYANPVTGVAAGFWNGGNAWTTSATADNEEATKGIASWTFTFPTLAAGRYSLRATATDTAGNTSSSDVVAFWVDPNAPTVLSVETPANGTSVSTLSAINGTTSDASDGSGVISVQCQLKRVADNYYWTGSAWSSSVYSMATNLSGTKWTRNSSLPSGANLKAGNYTITAIATDRAGNTKTITSSFTVGSTTTSAKSS